MSTTTRVGGYGGRVLAQERLIARVRQQCLADERIQAALMYGSFAHGEGDEHSDIEFWLFSPPAGRLDPPEWCARIAPYDYLTVNEFGTHVAFFPGLIRGEFHFASTDDIASVRVWPARGAAVAELVIVDRTGALTEALRSLPPRVEPPRTAAEIDAICGRFANWLVLAHHVAQRGEYLRALDALAHARRHLLWMARLATDRTSHWLTPSRAAEVDLPAGVLTALRATTATADPDRIAAALRASWACARDYWYQLGERTGQPPPAKLVAELDRLLAS
jgi:lincosamide nucleotidyltransferase